MKTEGNVAIVTGSAGKGMGRSIALTLAREGARVVVNYRTSRDEASHADSAAPNLVPHNRQFAERVR